MNKLNSNFFILLVIIFLNFDCFGAEKKSETIGMLNSADKSFDKIASYLADLESISYDENSKKNIEKSYLMYKKPNKSILIAFDEKGRKMGVILNDGYFKLTYIPKLKIAFKLDIKKINEKYRDQQVNPFDYIDKRSTSYVRDDMFDGFSCFVFEGKPNSIVLARDSDAPNKIETWVRKIDGIPTKMVFYSKDNKKISEEIFTNIKTNIAIDDKEFNIDLPRDVKIYDITEDKIVKIDIEVKGTKK